MNTRISHIFAWAHPRTAEVAVRGRALRGSWPCGLVPAAPPLLSLARAIRRSGTVLLLVLGLIFSWHTAQSQTFPVNALVQVSGFSPQLEAYDDPGRVVVTLISTDERPEYEALLRISLSGPGFNVRTREDFMPFPIILRRNQPLVLTGAQLRDYFDPANLNFQGATLENYLANGGLLSEGPVSLCVEVYDFNRFFDPPVSNTGCATGFMLLHRPPILTEPGTEVEPSFPQQLRFQWQPQHAGVAVRYTLEVYEDILPGMGDNLIIDNTQPLLLKTTTAPFYTMTSLDPLLQVGSRYLVRIRAEDIIGQAAFLNDGWSDIYSFVYGSEEEPPVLCPQPENFTGFALDPFTAQLSWLPDNTVASWLLTSVNGDSISLGDTAQTYTFTNLLHDQTYTYQLCAICTDGTSQCLKAVVTLPADTTSGPCGPALTLDNWPLDDTRLLLSWNDIPTAQGFRLRWGILPPNAPNPSTPVSPVPNRTERQLPQQSPVPAPRGRNRNRGLSPAPVPPLQAAPISTIGNTVFAYTDSLNLPAGSTDSEIGLLEIGNTYQIELCKTCPDGSVECVTTTVAFNGLDDACLASLNITRTDSTDTSLTLSWASATNDFSADSTFMLIWQLSDGSAPADTATLFYPSGTFTIDSLEAFRAYDLRICAECTAGQPACRELEPFGGCPAAYEPFLADLDFNNALIAWDTIPGDSLIPTHARYKARVAFRWDSLDVGRSTYFTPGDYDLIAAQTAEIAGLSQGITYLAQIQTQCADSIWSDWSVPVRFNTDCAVTDSLWLNELTDSSALVAALAYSNADYYEFQYRRTDQQEWTTVTNLPTALLTLSGLRAETEYEVRLRYWCTQGVWSDYTASFFFTTLPPCEPPFRITVDPILADAAQLNWDNYINATQVELRYRPKIGGYYYFSMWPPPWQTAVALDSSFYLNDLQGGAAYEYQLRSDCAVNFSEWTTVDEFALLCAPPEVITVTDSTYESAVVQLTGLPPSTQSSTLEYRRLGDSTWMSRTTSYGFASLQNLDDMTYYELRATATCSSGETSAYSDTVQFRTPVKCLVPENLVASNSQPFSTQLDWDVTGTVDEWEIRVYGPIGPTLPTVQGIQQAAPVQLGLPGGRTTPQSPGNPAPPSNTQPQNQQPSTRGGNVRQGGNPLNTGGPISGAPLTSTPITTAPLGVSVGQAPAPAPFADWHSFFVTNPTKLLEQLRQNTEYLVVVRARCPEFGWTDYSDTLSFRTLTDCRVPVNLVANEILQTTARTNWTAVNPYAEEYMVQLESLLPLTTVNIEAAPIQVQPGGGRTPQLPTGGGGGQSPQSPTGGQTPRIPSGGGDALVSLPSEELSNWFTAVYQDSILTPDQTAVFTGLRANTEYRFRVKSRCDNFGWTDYSDWLVFRTDHCAAPYAIVEEAIDRSTMNISWTPSNGINDYEFKYKLADDPGADWITIMTQDSFVELNSLLTNQIYDYQVTEICQGSTGQRFAPQDSFLMERPSLNNGFYVCGVEGQVDLSNQVPLAALIPGDTIVAFDFPIIITMASGGGGYFSGMGDIRMPYFNKAKFSFEFDNIFVNDEYRMVGGYLEATGFGVEVLPPWADSLLSDILDVLELADSVLQEEQIGILEDLMALGENANLPPDLQQDIQDVLDCFEQANTQAQIDSCNVLLDSVLVEVNEFLDQLYEGDFQVVFKKDQNQQFGFDAKGTQEPENWYDKRTLAQADYYVAYKSVKENSPDLVDGVVMPPGTIDSVAFSQPSGVPLPTTIDGDTATITFIGQTGDDYFLVAEQVTNDSTPNHIAGLLNVVPYPELPLNVVLVPLSSSAGNGINAAAVQQGLLQTLGQAVVKPTVTLEPAFTVPGYDGVLGAVGSGLLTNYSIEMRDIINAYENRPAGVDPDTYYLFITDSYEQTSRAGFMPRGRQFGFIYKGNAGTGPDLTRTIAHELAHGAYVLKHTFEEYASELPQGTTNNLMDYASGTRLYKWQWDLIHNPVNAPLLPGDEQSELLAGMDFEEEDNPPPPPPNSFPINPSCKFVKTGRGIYVKFSQEVLNEATFSFNSDGEVKAVNYKGATYEVRYSVKNLENQPGKVRVTVSPRFVNFALEADFTTVTKKDEDDNDVSVTTPTPEALLRYDDQTYCSSNEPGQIISYTSSGGSCTTKSCPWIINFAGVNIDTTGLASLISGGQPITTDDGLGNSIQRRTLRAYIVISKEGDQESITKAQNHSADPLRKIWLHQLADGSWTVRGTDGWSQNAKDFFTYHQSYTEQGLFAAIGSGFQALARGVYEFLDFVEKSLNYIKIPEYVWNCDSTDIYKPIYADVYGFIMAPINANIMLVLNMIQGTQLDELGFTTTLNQNVSRYQFAFLCGVWNGMIDILGTVPKLLKWVVDPVGEYTKFTDMLANLEKMERFKPDGVTLECQGYWCLLYELRDQFNFAQNPCTAFHNTAGVALGVACAVLTAGAGAPALASTSAGRIVLTIAKVLNKVEDMTDVLGIGFRIANKATGGIRRRILKLSDDFPMNKLGTIDGDKVTLIDKDGQPFDIDEADFKAGNITDDADGKLYYQKDGTGPKRELQARKRPGITWPLSFSGFNLRIKNWLDQLKVAGLVRLEQLTPTQWRVLYKKNGSEVEVSILDDTGTPDPNTPGTNYGEFSRDQNIAPNDQVLEPSPDGQMGMVEQPDGTTKLKACGCLGANTPVQTPQGLVQISQLREGDQVYATPANEEAQPRVVRVARRIESGANKMLRVFTEKLSFDITSGHALFVPQLGRTMVADSLRRGMQILSLASLLVTVDSVKVLAGEMPTYDIQLENQQGYLIGEDGIWLPPNYCNLMLKYLGFSEAQTQRMIDVFNSINPSGRLDELSKDLYVHSDLADLLKNSPDLDILELRIRGWNLASDIGDPLRVSANYVKSIGRELGRGVYSTNTLKTFLKIRRVDFSYNRLNDNDLLDAIPDISELETMAIHRYTVSSFDLNGNFYKQTPNSNDLAWAEVVDRAIDDLQVSRKFEGLVYRGQNLDYQLVYDKYISVYDRAQTMGTPAYVTETGYLSTSKAGQVADHFIDKFYNPDKIQVRFKIISKTGVDIDDISDYGVNLCGSNGNCDLVQTEVLMKKDLVFDITDIQDVPEVINGRSLTVKEITIVEQ